MRAKLNDWNGFIGFRTLELLRDLPGHLYVSIGVTFRIFKLITSSVVTECNQCIVDHIFIQLRRFDAFNDRYFDCLLFLIGWNAFRWFVRVICRLICWKSISNGEVEILFSWKIASLLMMILFVFLSKHLYAFALALFPTNTTFDDFSDHIQTIDCWNLVDL